MSNELAVTNNSKKPHEMMQSELAQMQVSDKLAAAVRQEYSDYIGLDKWEASGASALGGISLAILTGGIFFPSMSIDATVMGILAGFTILPAIAGYCLRHSSKNNRRLLLNWSIVQTVRNNTDIVPDMMGAYAVFIYTFPNEVYTCSYDKFIKSEHVDVMKEKFIDEKEDRVHKPLPNSVVDNLVVNHKTELSGKISNEMLKAIEMEWLETQSDIVQLLKYPLLADMREPLVQDFHVQLTYTKSMQQDSGESFSLAVAKLKMKWELVKNESKRVALSKFNDGERKSILLAMDLMKIALNEASSIFERKQAYNKAMKYLDRLISMPESTTLIIEQRIGLKELTS